MKRVLSLSVIALLLGLSLTAADDDFAGMWVNIDEKTRGLTRLEIANKGKGWTTVQAWAAFAEIGSIRVRSRCALSTPGRVPPR